MVVLCGLFFQDCKSGAHTIIVEEAGIGQSYKTDGHECDASEVLALVSGTHAQSSHPSFSHPDTHDQLLLASSPSSDLSGLCPPFAAAPALSIVQRSASQVRATDVSHIRFPSRSFTTSSGERVSFSKQGDRWQATLQYGAGSCMYECTLPVVSSENIETLLMHLQWQDIWASRSRIHVVSTAKPPCMPYAYLGKLGLLGGGPTRPVPPPILEDTKPAAKPNASNARADDASSRRTVLQVPQVQEGASEQFHGLDFGQNREQVQVEGERSSKRCRVEARGDDLCQTLATSLVFGEKDWQQYFGDVGAAPLLPADMDAILCSPCPFWHPKQVKDTHLLVLVPSTVNGHPFTLELLAQLARSPKGGGHGTEYRHCDGSIRRELGDQSPDGSYWILMTRDVLPGSLYKTCAAQDELIATRAHAAGLPYAIPCALEAATAILSHYVRTGERLYASSPEKYTRCREVVDTSKYPVMVGCFSPEGVTCYLRLFFLYFSRYLLSAKALSI